MYRNSLRGMYLRDGFFFLAVNIPPFCLFCPIRVPELARDRALLRHSFCIYRLILAFGVCACARCRSVAQACRRYVPSQAILESPRRSLCRSWIQSLARDPSLLCICDFVGAKTDYNIQGEVYFCKPTCKISKFMVKYLL